MNGTRYDKETRGCSIWADDISLYPQKAMRGYLTYGGGEKGERKMLPLNVRLIRTGTGDGMVSREPQITIELGGDYHVEPIVRPNEHPDGWKHYGKIWLSMDNAKVLARYLLRWANEVEEQKLQDAADAFI